ncbi:MAG: hypothetical protein CEN91_437 [Candidatus Berkelbacteria bacterium Licking1014_85]|uniref:Uncharacterized protein n=1 Tax=Candidatus Berkelbacteria bacterium Licking1014_85 TaxID=2017148 RepID=A0A554LHW1_9BACT|nr:MAG: hypothetical protein CEN91_437 [Candidatus Berkelbacteria bacterium Licking1014_85]
MRYKYPGSKPKYYATPKDSDIECIDFECHDIHNKTVYFEKPGFDPNIDNGLKCHRKADDIDRQIVDRIDNENIYNSSTGAFYVKYNKRGIYRKYRVTQTVG